MSVYYEGYTLECDTCHQATMNAGTKTRLRQYAKAHHWRLGPNWEAKCPTCIRFEESK